MIKLQFTSEEQKILSYERYHNPFPLVQRKAEVIFLKSLGKPHKEISLVAGVSPTTVTSYLKEYQEGGIEAIKVVRFYQPESELSKHQGTLEAYFREHPPASVKEAMAIIEKLTGVKRSLSRVRAFMKRMGLKCRKVGMIPAKADPTVQDDFKTKELEPRLKQAQEGQRAVFFVDAAHFVLAPFLGMLWCFTRIFIQAPAGRQRFNVLGALNAITHELIMVTNDSYINANTVCELLIKIAELQLGVPITLVLDNARYQKCKLVIALAKSLNIELLYLPSYSPNLNLIERIWKFVKKTCLYSTYYANFHDFKNGISTCLAQTHTKYRKEMSSLLTLKFQTFKNHNL